ncbi:hypothetical protein DH2020_016869 [Rehmannia glutinosa]|uniref:SS18 N-terminal domain-containing protein n=1 Tax=Rehmannia glutinosa TaxID=99300 RepID=A0ABR0WT00_REHGL
MMNKMQQQGPQTMNSAPSTPLNLVSTEQIQKYLDENKNLIMAILESQNMGKVAEYAQYQAILQKNLMYLAAIADAQPPGSTMQSQAPTSSVAPQGESHMLQTQASPVQRRTGGPVPKMPFQLNVVRPQDQQNQFIQFQQQQQLQGHFSLGGGGANNAWNWWFGWYDGFRGNQPGGLEASSGDGHGNLALGPMEGIE